MTITEIMDEARKNGTTKQAQVRLGRTVRNMIKDGYSDEDICTSLGITLDAVEKARQLYVEDDAD